jgi:hypothetical protein
MRHVFSFALVAALGLAGVAVAQDKKPEAQKTTLCHVKKDAGKFEGKLVELCGKLEKAGDKILFDCGEMATCKIAAEVRTAPAADLIGVPVKVVGTVKTVNGGLVLAIESVEKAAADAKCPAGGDEGGCCGGCKAGKAKP